MEITLVILTHMNRNYLILTDHPELNENDAMNHKNTTNAQTIYQYFRCALDVNFVDYL